MIGWRDYLGAEFDEKPKPVGGAYYCGCAYVLGEPNCVHHGDPVERWPEKEVKSDDATN